MKAIVLILFFALSIGLSPLMKGQPIRKLTIPEGKVGLIGYGSLMSIASMEKTLGREYNEAFITVHIKGFKRAWNYGRANNGIEKPLIAYSDGTDTIIPKTQIALNIVEDSNCIMNATLFIIDRIELLRFDEREQGYERVAIKDQIIDLYITEGDVYIYRALPDYTIQPSTNPEDNVIPLQYIDILEEAFDSLNQEFEKEYIISTGDYPRSIVKTAIRIHKNK